MRDAKPKLPIGTSPKWFFMRQVWFMLWGGRFPIKGRSGCKVSVEQGEYWISFDGLAPSKAAEKFHPFQLMPSPANDPATDWRTFRVRAGSYGTTPVAGTDGADVAAGGNTAEGVNSVENPATETLDAAYSTSIDFIVPDATLSYYVWIDATDPDAPEIDKGATPPGSGDDSAWWGGSFVLLAIIDTSTLTATKQAKWRQIVNYNIPKCS